MVIMRFKEVSLQSHALVHLTQLLMRRIREDILSSSNNAKITFAGGQLTPPWFVMHLGCIFSDDLKDNVYVQC